MSIAAPTPGLPADRSPWSGLLRRLGGLPPKTRQLPRLGPSVHAIRPPAGEPTRGGFASQDGLRGWTPVLRRTFSAHASVLDPGCSPHPPHHHL